MPEIDPIAWLQLPHDDQRLLSGSPKAVVINLWFNDDGSPNLSPSSLGERLFSLLLDGHANAMDAVRCACEFVESLTRKYP